MLKPHEWGDRWRQGVGERCHVGEGGMLPHLHRTLLRPTQRQVGAYSG